MDPRLADLVVRLEAAGLAVGPDVRLRLVQLAGALGWEDGDGLARAARAVVVKQREDRAKFDQATAGWRESLKPAPEVEAAPRHAGGERIPARPIHRPVVKRRWWTWALVVLAALIGTWLLLRPRAPAPVQPATNPKQNIEQPTPQPEATPKTVSLWTPVFGPPETPSAFARKDALAVGLLSLLALSALSWVAYRRCERPPSPPAEDRPFSWASTSSGPGPALLLRPVEQEALVWAVARRATEEPSPWLDLDATVAASSEAAGLPTLRFLPARWPAGLWLWVDVGAGHPELRRLADEIHLAVSRANLPVYRADFLGLPDVLSGPEGPRTPATASTSERRRRVVVLTDGLSWVDAARAAHRAGTTRLLNRELAGWPDLLVVDFGPDRSLSAMLGEAGVRAIPPEEAAAILGEAGRAPEQSTANLNRWAAAVALPGAPVDRATALRLRARLRLESGPWWVCALDDRRVLVGDPAGRAEAIRWLHAAEPVTGAALPAGWEAILAFWREELGDDPLWRPLLDLWEMDPGPAIERLTVEHRDELGWLAAMDDPPHREATVLPWKRGDLSAEHQSALARLGFGAQVGVEISGEIAQPARRRVGFGLLAALGLVGLAMGFLRGAPLGAPEIRDEGEPPPVPHWERCADGICRAGTGLTASGTGPLAPGSTVGLSWELAPEQPCAVPLPSGGALLRCTSAGSRAVPPAGRPDYSFIALNTDPASEAARRLATALLDGGSADLVLLSPAASTVDVQAPPTGFSRQALVLGVPEGTDANALWDVLRGGLDFTGAKTGGELSAAEELQASAAAGRRPFSTEASPFVFGSGLKLTWVTIPAGDGVIGDVEGGQGQDYERPQWQVRFTAPFEMMATEVTNRQYAAINTDHTPADDDKPVVKVNWDQANAFCSAVGGRLPTEAEWEFAARAGSKEDWPFPAAAGEDYAWDAQNSGNEAHDVRTRKPNPWGLYDMFGNAWEWVEDAYQPNAYATYAALPQPVVDPGFVDEPVIIPSSTDRVVRGGSFRGTSRNLRSSNRDWNRPGVQLSSVGFRCARGPRRQPLQVVP